MHERNPTTDRTWNGDTGTGSRTLQKDFVAFPLVKPLSDYSSSNIDLTNKHKPLYTSNDHEFPESVHERNPTTDRTLNGTGSRTLQKEFVAFPLVKHVEQAPRSNEIVERYGTRKRSTLAASETVRLSGIANTYGISRDRHRVAPFKGGLIFTDTNTIPAMSENTPQKHFSSHDSSGDRHYRSALRKIRDTCQKTQTDQINLK